MSHYTIVTGDGGELTCGIQSLRDAVRIAQEYANCIGKPGYVSGPGIPMDPDDDDDIGREVEPEAGGARGAGL